MPTMRLTLLQPEKGQDIKVDLNPNSVAMMRENWVGFNSGASIQVKESLRSLRHQYKKALTNQAALLADTDNSNED